MSVDLNKTPEQIKEDATKDVQAALLDGESNEKARNAVIEALKDPEAQKKAYEDVKALATTIRDIRAGFIEVAGDLIGFDSVEFKDVNGNIIKLGSQWAPHIKVCVVFVSYF